MSIPSSDQKSPPPVDDTDYAHRRRVNMIAGITIVVIAAGCLWGAYIFYQHEQLDRCVTEGRRDCIDLGVQSQPPTVVTPVQ